MNTPSHIILNLAILGRRQGAPAAAAPSPGRSWAAGLGGFLPDAPLFLFYGWAKLWVQAPERQIWRELYNTPIWQDFFALSHSIPLALVGWGLARWRKSPIAMALFASMLLHDAADLPLHNADAHRHFFPLSNFRFISPVSYWDVNHFGAYAALGEWILVMVASVALWRRGAPRLAKVGLIAVNSFYLLNLSSG